MKDDFFGVCHVRNNAFSSSLAGTSTALPSDYADPFAVRVRASDCCAVVRTVFHGHGKAPPRRCGSKRRLWNPNQPEKAMQCCQAHRGSEFEARRWMAERGNREG